MELEKTKCYSFGEVALLDNDTLEITELPIGLWTEDFAAHCKKWLGGKDPDDPKKEYPQLIDSFEDYSSDSRIKFIVKLTPSQMKTARSQGYHHYLGLVKAMTYTNTMASGMTKNVTTKKNIIIFMKFLEYLVTLACRIIVGYT